jgi:hypothetical protein
MYLTARQQGKRPGCHWRGDPLSCLCHDDRPAQVTNPSRGGHRCLRAPGVHPSPANHSRPSGHAHRAGTAPRDPVVQARSPARRFCGCRHPADRVQTVLPVRNHPWPSHCWQPPVAAEFLSASRGRFGKSLRILANRSSRHRSLPLVARPPTGASSCRSMTIATSFKRRIDELPAIDIHSL